MRKKLLIPLIVFVFVVGILWRGLSLHASEIPSPLINEPTPNFSLPRLMNSERITTNKDFLGHVTLVNVWASWCPSCAEEHDFLMKLSRTEHVFLYGINYKDQPEDAIEWVTQHGNPYKIIAVDKDGKAAIDWGVYGTPEMFIIDKHGIIRYKKIGAIDEGTWINELKPIVVKLQKEKA